MNQPQLIVDVDGTVSISRDALAALGLHPGAHARLEIREDSVVIRRPISDLARVYIELTNACNIDCRTCMRSVWATDTGYLSRELFARLRDQLAAMRQKPLVFLGGIGEPLFHPHAVEFVAALHEIGVKVDLITNGTLLTPDRVSGLISAGLRRLWVSIDGSRPESYSDVRLGASLPAVLENLADLKFQKLRHATTRPDLGIAMVVMERNVADLPEVVKLGLDLDAVRFSISNVLAHNRHLAPQVLYNHESTRWNPKRAVVDLPRIDVDDPRVLSALRGVIGAGSRTRGEVDLDIFPQRNSCPFIEKGSMSIRWDGAVAPCLALLHSHSYYLGDIIRMHGEHMVGDANRQSLEEIWTDSDYVDLRERLVDFGFSPCTTCRSCERIRQNAADCTGNATPACGGCLWAQGFIRCP